MAASHNGRLSDDILLMIFKLVCEEDQAALNDYLEKENVLIHSHWDDWGEEFIHGDYDQWKIDLADSLSAGNVDEPPPPSTLSRAMSVCKHWYSLVSQTPSMWTVLEISFREGAAALEHARTFLQRGGSRLISITLLWDDPAWIVPLCEEEIEGGLPPPSHEEMMAGVYLGSVIQELYAHVHRWREFTLRTTSFAHTRQALLLMSRPSAHSARGLEKLHLQFVHNPRHAVHYISEPSLFPGSTPPVRDLVIFGISWAWPSSAMLSANLVDLRIHYLSIMNEGNDDANHGSEEKILSQFLGTLVNLRTLALEVDLSSFTAETIELPRLHSLAIKSSTMSSWAVDFLHNVQMPELRILTLCINTEDFEEENVGDILDELVNLTDSDENPETPLELDELHLFNFSRGVDVDTIRRLFTQMLTVETLTLGPGAINNVALAMGLLPTPHGGLAELPLSGIQTFILFDIPKYLIRQIVLERQSLAGPMEELYCRYREGKEADDWQRHVEKFHRIDKLKSDRYTDVVARRWSYLV
ncbi:uncharacterized protein EDB93DRAFT_686640 [Suillus bovinus]|uniref:uncharacterized protein n=1 Tax=Suillus bovinus TaxID=48563 RepID=UPI001B87309E|nr:uncharacterized protein EDB93DRAFT_686640 [Suillus bovinus]KAG2140249.1 hypothetical protein EDB93DRAFT_686640 [Suillus bovinus]